MSNSWFCFKKFKINQDKTAMKVGVDSLLFGVSAGFCNPNNVLDIGAGTGLLSFMAEQRTNAKITAIEIDYDAYNQCVENIIMNSKESKIDILNISVQKFVLKTDNKFDHIICNPPFFENSFLSKDNTKNIARHTVQLTYNELIICVSSLLSKNGIFSVIVPFDNLEKLMQLSLENFLFCKREILIFPKENKTANRVILEFSKLKKKMKNEMIIVRDKNTNEYTTQYKELTKDFYLNF